MIAVAIYARKSTWLRRQLEGLGGGEHTEP
jgi:hypothetical protein